MSRQIFKSFEGKLNGDTRTGVIITPTTKGLKIETFTTYNNDTEYIYYITETPDYNKDTNWTQVINDYGTTNWQQLLFDLQHGLKPYRVIKK